MLYDQLRTDATCYCPRTRLTGQPIMTLQTITSRTFLRRWFGVAITGLVQLALPTFALAQTNTLSFSPAIPQAGDAITVTVTRVPGNCLVGGTYSSTLSGTVLTITHAFSAAPPPPPPVGFCTESYNIGSLTQGTYQVIWEERFDFLASQRTLIASNRLTISSAASVPLSGGAFLVALIAAIATFNLLKRK